MDNPQITMLKKKLAAAAKVTALVGQFVGVDGGDTFVDVGGGRIPAFLLGPLPQVGANVHVWFVNGQPFIMGPTDVLPSTGTVTAVSGLTVTVSTLVGNFTLPFLSWYGPVVGDVVKIAWGDMPIVLGVPSTKLPDPPKPPPPPAAASAKRIDVFTAIDTGSYNQRWWQDEIWASDNNTGAAFYGTKIRDTLKGRAVLGFQVYISAIQIYGDRPNFVTHTSAKKPAGNVSVSNRTPVAVKDGWLTLPNSMGQQIVDNGGGLGVDGGGFNKFRSIGQDRQSFALRITTI